MSSLCYQLDKLKRVLANLGVRMHWPAVEASASSGGEAARESDESARLRPLVLASVELHRNLFDLDATTDRLRLRQPHAQLASAAASDSLLFESAGLYIALCSYRNQLVNHLVRVSLVAMALLSGSTVMGGGATIRFNLTAAFEVYKFWTILFNREFIFRTEDENTRKDFNDALNCLLHLNLLKRSSNSSRIFNKHYL